MIEPIGRSVLDAPPSRRMTTSCDSQRHCEEQSDEAIHLSACRTMDCFASLAMTTKSLLRRGAHRRAAGPAGQEDDRRLGAAPRTDGRRVIVTPRIGVTVDGVRLC